MKQWLFHLREFLIIILVPIVAAFSLQYGAVYFWGRDGYDWLEISLIA